METKVIIKSDGVYIERSEWNGQTQSNNVTEFQAFSLLTILGDPVEFAQGLKFGEFMNSIVNDPNAHLLSAIFTADVGGRAGCMQEFENILKNPCDPEPVPQKGEEGISYLEIYANPIEINAEANKYDREYSSRLGFHGVGPQIHPSTNEVSQGLWAIETTPVNELAHYELKLNPIIKITDKNKPVCEYVYQATVYDVIRAIVWEMSFCGICATSDQAFRYMGLAIPEQTDSIDRNNLPE
jgi:hypothetical protein